MRRFFHQRHNICKRGIFIDGSHVDGHNFGDFAAMRMAVVGRHPPRPHEEFQPTRAVPFGAGFLAAKKTAFRENADQFSNEIDHR